MWQERRISMMQPQPAVKSLSIQQLSDTLDLYIWEDGSISLERIDEQGDVTDALFLTPDELTTFAYALASEPA
jgi:hypothetical protein